MTWLHVHRLNMFLLEMDMCRIHWFHWSHMHWLIMSGLMHRVSLLVTGFVVVMFVYGVNVNKRFYLGKLRTGGQRKGFVFFWMIV